ncbi:MAG TPA: isoprenylcysteine carboxylmethyltransferase family protein [Parafilimonas sp.]|jgi:protein-S-isoprenylcysteine O-methyltransferase Ste14|nr:isoprenylcysteine carboxylmethyltransferase family protein [Parafilimonas sp.]
MQKIVSTLIFVFIVNIFPLLFKPELLVQFKPIIILIGTLAMFLTQPAFSLEETRNNKHTDKYSIVFILIASAVSVGSSLIEWAYFSDQSSNLFLTILGILMIIIGLIIRITAINTLGKFFTATARTTNEHLLITSGPFSIMRHPSYAGAILVITGVPVLLNNLITFFSTILLLFFAYDFRIKSEEKVLISTFGEKYLQYSLKVKKIVPHLW